MSASIEIQNVSKRYGDVTVLKDITLDIKGGEFVVFLGPSGCGKSTLLRMIAGLETVSEGEIHLDNQRIDQLAPGQRGVAMVFQSYALYPHMSVAQNMRFGLENEKIPKDEIKRRVQAVAEILEIHPFLNRKPAKLSGGQRQRVAIGRALVKEPKAFLFDEPLSNLDAALRGRTRLELAQLHQELGATMIFVTHDQVEAMTLANRIVVLNNNIIQQVGSPMEIYHRPANKFVAGFVGSPAMAFLPLSHISEDGKKLTIENIGEITSHVPLPPDFLIKGAEIGLRAEDTFITDNQNGLKLTVKVIERLGERTLLYGYLPNGAELIVQDTGRSTKKAGDVVYVGANPDALHIFDGNGMAYHKED